MKLKVTLGDWSNDGHGMTEMYVVELPAYIDKEEEGVEEMYKIGVNSVGFDLSENICSNYEDSTIDRELYEKLIALGYKPYELKKERGLWDESPEVDEECDIVYLSKESFLDIYMFFVAIGFKKEYSILTPFYYDIVSDEIPEVNIGGYGLFYN